MTGVLKYDKQKHPSQIQLHPFLFSFWRKCPKAVRLEKG
jgi:hypothetical protein